MNNSQDNMYVYVSRIFSIKQPIRIILARLASTKTYTSQHCVYIRFLRFTRSNREEQESLAYKNEKLINIVKWMIK